MSANSWRKDFYSVAAAKLAEKSDIEAVNHSIRKWEGALPKNLNLHKLEEPPVYFGTESCALCQKHYNEDALDNYPDITDDNICASCPIFKMREGVACYRASDNEDISPYYAYTQLNNPEPMLKVLKKTRKYCIEAELNG